MSETYDDLKATLEGVPRSSSQLRERRSLADLCAKCSRQLVNTRVYLDTYLVLSKGYSDA